jgi:hypothetical protein
MFEHLPASPVTSYCFSVSDCLDLLRPVAALVPCEAVVQAELEEFGIEFRFSQTLTGRQQLLAVGADAEWIDHTIEAMQRYLRAVLPWTPGPPRPEGMLLQGDLRHTSLYVGVSPWAAPSEESVSVDFSDDYYPERLRRHNGRL